jgi:hypothetical protein
MVWMDLRRLEAWMECENLRILYVIFRVYSMYEFIGDVGSERMEIWKLGI